MMNDDTLIPVAHLLRAQAHIWREYAQDIRRRGGDERLAVEAEQRADNFAQSAQERESRA